MKAPTRRDVEAILRTVAVTGILVLLTALLLFGVGTLTRTLVPEVGAVPWFLIAILAVTAPYADLVARREHARRRIPADERLGFVPFHSR